MSVKLYPTECDWCEAKMWLPYEVNYECFCSIKCAWMVI